MRYIPARDHALIFVTGLPRSGTTLMVGLLRAADGVSGLSEPHNCLWTHGQCLHGDGLPSKGVQTLGELRQSIIQTKASSSLTVVKEVFQPIPSSPLEHLGDYLLDIADRTVVMLRDPVQTIASQLAVLGPTFEMWLGRMIDFTRSVDRWEKSRDVRIVNYHALRGGASSELNAALSGIGTVPDGLSPAPFKGFGDRRATISSEIGQQTKRASLSAFKIDTIKTAVGDWYANRGVFIGQD